MLELSCNIARILIEYLDGRFIDYQNLFDFVPIKKGDFLESISK